MENNTGSALLSTSCFHLGLLGARLTQAFSAHLDPLGISHKQIGLLAVVDAGLATSQREIASRLRVAPSLVVSLVDQLIELGAVTRSRSDTDRRVQRVALTERGRELLAASARIAAAVDRTFHASLSPAGQSALTTLLSELDTLHPHP